MIREVAAVFVKEARVELRTRNALFSAALFSLLAVVAIGYASSAARPGPTLAAGMLCVTLLFAGVVALPRTFLAEEDQGTFDLLRLLARPGPAFVGKLAYNAAQMLGTGLILGVLFAALTGVEVRIVWLYALGIALECLALAAAVSLCSALAIGAANRWVLAGAVSLPLLLPQVALGVGCLRVALGEGSLEGGVKSLIGIGGFALANLSAGPILAEAAWRIRKTP